MAATIDHFVAQGDEHTICQDYALTGGIASGGNAWAIVCDGCSASPDTDWGARLLAQHIARQFDDTAEGSDLDTEQRFRKFALTAYRGARQSVDALGLPAFCLDATLLFARTDGNRIRIGAWGDGVVARRQRSCGIWEISEITFPAGYPDYLSYRFAHQRRVQWEAVSENRKRIRTHYFGEEPARTEQVCNCDESMIFWDLPVDEYDCIVLCTDGAGAFRTGSGKSTGIDTATIMETLLAFKGMSGSFLRRRWQRIQKENRASGRTHYDDFSSAGIYLPEVTTGEGKEG